MRQSLNRSLNPYCLTHVAKRRIAHTLWGIWLAAAAAIFAISCQADDSASREAQLRTLQTQIATVQSQLKQKNSQLGELEQAIAASEKAIGTLARQIRELVEETKQIEAAIDALQQESQQLNQKIEEQKQHLSDQLVELYKQGNPSPIQLLLDSGNPADIDRQLVYLEHINRQRMALLSEFRDLLAEQKRLEQQQVSEQARLVAATDTLRNREQLLQDKQQQRRTQVEALNADIATRSSRLDVLEQNKQALEALIEEITTVFEQQPDEAFEQPQALPSITFGDFASAKGKLPWPVKSKARHNEHDGVTLPAAKGEAVRAIYPGRVIFADWFRGQGLLVIVDHGNRYWSLYGHNESLLKSPGDAVAAGETIATVGNSGGYSKTGLYFEIRHQGKPLKPTRWCRR